MWFLKTEDNKKPPKYHVYTLKIKLVKVKGTECGEKAKEPGFDSIIVLGQKEYYPKFGFQRASRWNIKCPFEVPDEVFMAIELIEKSLEGKAGTVEYPDEFNDV